MPRSRGLNLNFKIPDPNAPPPSQTRRPPAKIMTMKVALRMIEEKGLEPDVRDALVKRISRYPANSLNAAWGNLDKIVAEITNKLRGEWAEPEPEMSPAFAAFLERNKKVETNEQKEIDKPDEPKAEGTEFRKEVFEDFDFDGPGHQESSEVAVDGGQGESNGHQEEHEIPQVRTENRPSRRKFSLNVPENGETTGVEGGEGSQDY